jgi:hypothetical protein
MKKFFVLLGFVLISRTQYGQIIADHTVVDKFDKIPQFYINKVKTMWMSYPGESHSEAIRRGLELLEAAYPAYQVEVAEYTSPAPYTSAYLRADANTWGDLTNATGWIRWYGEEDWYTSAAAIARTKAGIAYCNTTGPALSAIGFGLCYGDGGGDYITATQQYVDYCTANAYPTKVFFTTGPVDQALHLYSWTAFYNAIRSHVAADPKLILFDFADILCYNNDGSGPNTTTDEGHTVPFITTESATPNVGGFHFSNAGAMRLAKAMWWMLARMAGWDGSTITGIDDPGKEKSLSASIEIKRYELRIKLDESILSATIKLYNLTGSLIYAKKADGDMCVFDISHLPAGIYLVNISKSNFNRTQKIIIP